MRPLRALFPQPGLMQGFPEQPAFASDAVFALTGHRGVVGRLLARRLQAQGLRVEGFEGDVTDTAAVDAWIAAARPTHVVHLAAIVPTKQVRERPFEAMRVNAFGTLNLCQAVAAHSPGAWLFCASTSHVYRAPPDGAATPLDERAAIGPITYYGHTKLAGEQMARACCEQVGQPLCTGRIFSITHEEQPTEYLVPSLFSRLRAAAPGETVRIVDANCSRDFLLVDDVVTVILNLAAARTTGIVNIASGEARTVGELARRVRELTGSEATLELVEAPMPSHLLADVSRLRALREARP